MEQSSPKAIIMDEVAVSRAIKRIAHEIVERNEGCEDLALVGIVTRGDLLAKELARQIEEIEGVKVPLGRLVGAREDAEFAAYLCSEAASCFVGQVFPVCGGWVVR